MKRTFYPPSSTIYHARALQEKPVHVWFVSCSDVHYV